LVLLKKTTFQKEKGREKMGDSQNTKNFRNRKNSKKRKNKKAPVGPFKGGRLLRGGKEGNTMKRL